jgi:subtilisin family serine protease
VDAIEAGVRLINLSAALTNSSLREGEELRGALDLAAQRGVIVVAAAGNQGMVGSTPITRHPWVVPVVACDLRGRPSPESNLGHSIGRAGLRAPGENVTSVDPDGRAAAFGGTSAAAPIVTGAIALLWSEFPSAPSTQIKSAVMMAGGAPRQTVVPPLLNAWAAYQSMTGIQAQRAGEMNR